MNHHSWPQTIRIILFSCLIGGAAGVLGTAWTTSSLSQYAVELGEVTETLRLSQPRPRTLPQSYADALDRLESRALPAVGLLFESQQVGKFGVSVFEAKASTVALTSDGWMLSREGSLGDKVSIGSQTCEINTTVEEPRLGWVFLHCDASNIPVMDIVGAYDISAGASLFVVENGRGIVFTQARAVVWNSDNGSSDVASRRIMLPDGADAEDGALVFNVYGELVGVVEQVDTQARVVPFEHLAGSFEQVLQSTQTIVYPALGVVGIDIAHTVGLPDTLTQGRHAGFVVTQTVSTQIEIGDVIFSIEGISIDAKMSLDDLVAQYAPEDEIQVDIDRAGAQQTITVTLGELEL
ncbi:hypothetical protein HY733_01115 [Candidatus Uhrbacteria bacterium]|nr:hypothetical protein [Candidatus Uhrbacteria bacterium]